MEVAYLTNEHINELSARTPAADNRATDGVGNPVSNHLRALLGEAAGDLARLSRSVGDAWVSSAARPAPALHLTDPLHHVPDLTHLFRAAFEHLQPGGYLICRLETAEQRKHRLLRALPPGLTHLRYAGDFLLHRLAPRLFLTRPFYRHVFATLRTISKAEAFGRLYHAGFAVREAVESGGQLVIIAQKTGTEFVERPPSSEGVLLRMWRVGEAGHLFCVFKLRTMHPYSEYLQEYLMETGGLATSGKFQNDFRITTLGRWLRKYWLDEVPMLINMLRGDMKLVGVRPLSAQYFRLYPPDVQHERCRHKPGLLPPYYADLPKTFADIVESERRYLRAYAQSPVKTDLAYLAKIGFNIVWKRAHSG